MGILLVAAVVVALVALTSPLGNTGRRREPEPATDAVPHRARRAGPRRRRGRARLHDRRAPTARTFRLTDLDGKPVTLADLRGKAVWVNFWASWCPPCQAETPVLRQIAATYRDAASSSSGSASRNRARPT